MNEGLQLHLFLEEDDPVLEETTLEVIDKLRVISEVAYYDDRVDEIKSAFLRRYRKKRRIVDTVAIELALLKGEQLTADELIDYHRNCPVETLKNSLRLLEGIQTLDEISEEDFTVACIASEIVARELVAQGHDNFVIKHYTGDEL